MNEKTLEKLERDVRRAQEATMNVRDEYVKEALEALLEPIKRLARAEGANLP